jgi:RNA polymerase sigma-70 factor (ECF subfamily)
MRAMDAGALMPDTTLPDVDGRAGAAEAVALPPMDEEAFRAFYDRTARPVWAYLAKITGEPRAADDLLQEAYYRFFRAGVAHESESHRRNYLYRIATNLVRDRARRGNGAIHVPFPEDDEKSGLPLDTGARSFAQRADLARAMAELQPRQRELLWLAYAEGSSHEEIAQVLGVRAAHVRTLLLRARRKLLELMRAAAGDGGEGGRRG